MQRLSYLYGASLHQDRQQNYTTEEEGTGEARREATNYQVEVRALLPQQVYQELVYEDRCGVIFKVPNVPRKHQVQTRFQGPDAEQDQKR